jgi:hypothetical protein
MHETARLVEQFLRLALAHPEGPAVARAFDRVLQVELADDAPFWIEARDGRLTVGEGERGLDWRWRDWERVTGVRTSSRVLRGIVAGRRLISEAFFDQELGFGAHQAADRESGQAAIVAWLYTLVRLAHEEGRRAARRRVLAELGV